MDEITAEYAVEQLAPAADLRVRTRISLGAKTDLGRVRENNEDKFEFYLPDDDAALAARGQVFVVCDGMGGHAAGQIASELACKTFIDVYLHHPSADPEVAMTTAVTAANRYVVDVGRTVPGRSGMGTTLVGLILLQGEAWVVWIGDSRGYRLRDGALTQLTRDHTFVEEMVRYGSMTQEEAENHPHRHVLTRAIGADSLVVPEVVHEPAQVGDVYLLCSDGVTNHVDDAALAQILETKGPAEAAWTIVGQALQGGGSDNATVLVVRVDGVETPG